MDGHEVPEKISRFHLNNDIQHFQYDRPFHKGPRDKDNEFKVSSHLHHWSKHLLKLNLNIVEGKMNALVFITDIMGGEINLQD